MRHYGESVRNKTCLDTKKKKVTGKERAMWSLKEPLYNFEGINAAQCRQLALISYHGRGRLLRLHCVRYHPHNKEGVFSYV